jgi:hypothetical protein
MSQKVASIERRWAAISADGRHVWLGRDSDPTESELASLTGSLSSHGTTAWLAIVEGDYWGRKTLNVLHVKDLSGQGDWPQAVFNFLELRKALILGLK